MPRSHPSYRFDHCTGKVKAIHGEKFNPTDESLTQYHYPEWFRDAKLGFWSHRG